MSVNYDVADLINNLIDLEKNGCDFYNTLAEKTDKIECKLMFKLLAEEEKKHQDIYTALLQTVNIDVEIDSEYHEYLQVIVNEQFKLDSSQLESCKDTHEALDIAINLEKDSLLFLSEFGNLVGPESQHLVDQMKKEERKHLKMIIEMKRTLI